MFKVSKEFLEKIKAGRRRVLGMVKVYWTDPFFLKDSDRYKVVSDSTLEGCLPQQILDESSLNERKWKHFDGTTKFSDEIYPAPTTVTMAMAERGRVGWWSNIRSDSEGYFFPPISVAIEHLEPKTVFDILVSGDDAYEEYPLDFIVRLYSDGGTYEYNVTDNQFPNWRGEIPESVKLDSDGFDFKSVTKMELEISRWNKGGRVAKITMFTIVNEMIFESDDIFSIDLVEELEVTEGSLPIGTASANEIDISFNNIKDRFYVENPATDLKNVLLPNRQIKPYIGVQLTEQSYEWVPLGTFWTGSWNTVESSIAITVTARDRMELLRQMRFLGSPVHYNRSLYSLAIEVLESARSKLPDLEYDVSEQLKEIVIPVCYLPVEDYMSALKTIASACLGYVYVDRLGVVHINNITSFVDMKPWKLGEFVWTFDDGDEKIGETCQKSFATSGVHSGILYVTEDENVIIKKFYIEVRDTEVETPYRATLQNENKTAIGDNLFIKTSSIPLRYDLTFEEAGAKKYFVTVHSKDGKSTDTRVLNMEVRRVAEASLFTLESNDDLTVSKIKMSPTQYYLYWKYSGGKEIIALVGDTQERIFCVEVRAEAEVNWLIHKV
jgi:hypothetical protein